MDQAHKPPILTITKAPDASAPPSCPPDRKCKPIPRASSLETVPESDSARAQPRHASSPADASKAALRGPSARSNRSEKGPLALQRSQYFHDALHERSASSAAASVRGEALIHAELKTNVKIDNEHHFLTTLANHLAARYNRHPSSTVISLHHSQSLLFGGSPSPAYTLAVTALACEVQPATNKRNAAVLQKHLEALLRVPPARGMVRFVPVAEECLAWGGKTVAGRISEAMAGDGEELKAQERGKLKALSLRRSAQAEVISPRPQATSPLQNKESAFEGSNTHIKAGEAGMEGNVKVVKKKKSIIHALFRTSRVGDEDSASRGS